MQLDLRTVDLGGPVTYAELGGSGRPIVCVHGLGGNILNWVVLAPLLGRLGRVVALDLPGFGRSPLAGRSTRIGDQARVLARFLGHIGQPAMLLGSSMGGLIALQVAWETAPEGLPGRISWALDSFGVRGIQPGLNLELRPRRVRDAANVWAAVRSARIIRRTATAHGIVSFVFNTALLALMVNIAASAI